MCLAERINYTPNAYYYWRRLNKDASDDLKDYTLPFKRSDEIHKWLEANNIKGDEIYSNLYAREMAYISIVFGKRYFKEIDNALVLVDDLLNKIDKNLLRTTKNVNSSTKRVNELIFNSPIKYRRKIIFKKFKQNLISIRWNKYEKRIILFGKTILSGQNKTIREI